MKKRLLLPLSFQKGIFFNAIGSTAFETLKLVHQALLFYLIPLEEYGRVGTIFSLLFGSISFFSFALDAILPAFINDIFSSKQKFKNYLFVLAPLQVLFLMVGGSAALAFIFYNSGLLKLPFYFSLFFISTCISEGLRIAVRSLLHARALHNAPTFIDFATMVFYVGTMWIPFLIHARPLNLFTIFIPYCFCSLISFFVLCYCIALHYQTLPSENNESKIQWGRFFKSRFLLYGSKISTLLFTGNVLVPFFMIRFGLRESAVFKFASYGIDFFRGVLHATLGFTSSALFAQLKNASWENKKEAFYKATSLLNNFLLRTLAIYTAILLWGEQILHQPFSQNHFFIFLIFFIMLFILEKNLLIYENLYIVEERTDILVFTKTAELFAGLFIMYVGTHLSPYTLLLLICTIRLSSNVIVGLHAYKTWHLAPINSTTLFEVIALFTCSIVGAKALTFFLNLVSQNI